MKKIMFNDRYGLTQAVLDGKKTMTRREIKLPDGITHSGMWNPVLGIDDNGKVYFTFDCIDCLLRDIYPLYRIGEEGWVAQSYKNLGYKPDDWIENAEGGYQQAHEFAGYTNKMFVRSLYLEHRIRITYIKVERLQGISTEDCMKEGIMKGEFMNTWDTFYFDEWGDVPNHITFKRPHDAFRNLIDRISGKETWNRNPWVFAYTFKLIS